MGLFKKKALVLKEDQDKIVAAIQQAEKMTSGEIRVFMEARCKYVQAIERATEIFFRLKMDQTKLRNGVIIYVAIKDKQSAILGDKGIYEVTGGPKYWEGIIKQMNDYFKKDQLALGLTDAIFKVGDTLSNYFPYDPNTDKNELPDDIIFGN